MKTDEVAESWCRRSHKRDELPLREWDVWQSHWGWGLRRWKISMATTGLCTQMGTRAQDLPKIAPANTNVPDFVPTDINWKPLKASILGSERFLYCGSGGIRTNPVQPLLHLYIHKAQTHHCSKIVASNWTRFDYFSEHQMNAIIRSFLRYKCSKIRTIWQVFDWPSFSHIFAT